MSDLLALDPSVRSPGVALFRDGVLVFAGRVKIPPSLARSDGERWQEAADEIVAWAKMHDVISPDVIIYERPQIYRAVRSKGDPNDLIGLAAIGAAVAAMYPGISEIQTPTPAEWCGQIPKATKGSAKDSPRAKRILSRLSAIELERAPNQHDAIDAIGLGLHSLGRLGIKRVYSTST